MAKRVLILSGPTHEYIDPVRFIGNASSGLMGKALAEEALRKGYDVELISGPVSSENLPDLNPEKIHKVTSAEEMLKSAQALFETAHIILFSAAVADYTPTEIRTEKIDKSSDELILRLRPTPDIAKTLGLQKRDHQMTIGFALQTANGQENARRKLKSKNFDGIVLNTPASLGAPTGQLSFLLKNENHFKAWGLINKTDCARNIFKAIAP